MLNSQHQEFRLHTFLEMWKQSALEAAEDPEVELMERTTVFLKFAVGIGVIDVDVTEPKYRKQQLCLES